MAGPHPDAGLVTRKLYDDPDRFALLCEQQRRRLWRIAASVARGPDAEDLAQEAVVRAYSALRGFRGEAPFDAWLCRIAVNVAHDYVRSAWRRRVSLLEEPQPDEPGGESIESAAARRELQRRVRQAVASLPEAQRVPIWLHFFEGFTLAEVSRLERTPEATVRSRVRAGMRRLSLSLGDLLPETGESRVVLEADPKGCET